MEISRVFQAHLRELDTIMKWSRDVLKELAIGSTEQTDLELILEEAIVNIINHAYTSTPGLIELHFIRCENEIELVIKDQGMPFNPIEKELEARLDAPIEERQEGGLGIYFIKKLADKLSYNRNEDTNILKIVKSID